MSKKIVSVILSLCIIVCALPMNILAAPEQNETLTFNGVSDTNSAFCSVTDG